MFRSYNIHTRVQCKLAIYVIVIVDMDTDPGSSGVSTLAAREANRARQRQRFIIIVILGKHTYVAQKGRVQAEQCHQHNTNNQQIDYPNNNQRHTQQDQPTNHPGIMQKVKARGYFLNQRHLNESETPEEREDRLARRRAVEGNASRQRLPTSTSRSRSPFMVT